MKQKLQYFVIATVLFFLSLVNGQESAQLDYKDIRTFFPNIDNDLTKISWAHGVNTKAALDKALRGPRMMIEANIVLGRTSDHPNSTSIPVLGNRSVNTSDISLQEFLWKVIDFNKNAPQGHRKGIKLDFKTLEAYEKSLAILETFFSKISFPVWLNGDIIAGPVKCRRTPLDPSRFLKTATKFENATISVGWTTRYKYTHASSGSYSDKDIKNMVQTLSDANIHQSLTFSLKAGLASNSIPQLKTLIEMFPASSIVLSSNMNDNLDMKKLRKLIFTIGVDKLFLDLPMKVVRALKIHNGLEANTSDLPSYDASGSRIKRQSPPQNDNANNNPSETPSSTVPPNNSTKSNKTDPCVVVKMPNGTDHVQLQCHVTPAEPEKTWVDKILPAVVGALTGVAAKKVIDMIPILYYWVKEHYFGHTEEPEPTPAVKLSIDHHRRRAVPGLHRHPVRARA